MVDSNGTNYVYLLETHHLMPRDLRPRHAMVEETEEQPPGAMLEATPYTDLAGALLEATLTTSRAAALAEATTAGDVLRDIDRSLEEHRVTNRNMLIAILVLNVITLVRVWILILW